MTPKGEYLVAVLGVSHALSKKWKDITEAEVERSAKLPEKIRKRVKELVAAPKAAKEMGPPELPDYHEMHEAFARDIDEESLSESMVNLPQEIMPSTAQAFARGVAYLSGIFPRRVQALLTGPKLHDPSPGEWAEWGWAWRIAKDPMVMLELAQEGILISIEVTHLQAMFPGIYSDICAAIQDSLADAIAKDPEWTVPWWLQKQLCTILGVSPVSPTLLADIESAIKQSSAETKSRTSALKLNTEVSTPNQRLAEK
jgi:hypothetical protein